MKKLNYMTMILLSAICSLMLSQCSDNNTLGVDEEDEDELFSAENDSVAYENMLDALIAIDTLSTGNIERKVNIGRVLYAETPQNYYYTADSLEEALKTFYSLIVPIGYAERVTELPTGDLEFSLLDANLLFHKSPAGDYIASIDIHIKEIPEIEKLFFIQSEEWPYNDSSSPFQKGFIYKNIKNGWLYICTKTNSKGSGKLITFDGGWKENWFTTHTYFQGKFFLYDNCASREAWDGMNDLLADSYAVENLYNTLVELGYKNTPMCKNLKQMLWDDGSSHLYSIGDVDWKKKYWAKYVRYYYKVWMKYYNPRKKDFENKTFKKKQTPEKGEPSSEFTFSAGFFIRGDEWKEVAIF